MPTCIRKLGRESERKCLQASSLGSIKVSMPDEREAEPILKFRKRPEEEEAEIQARSTSSTGSAGSAGSVDGPPVAGEESRGSELNFHWEITLTPALLTTNTGIVDLTSRVQQLLDEIVRGMLKDKSTPVHHPAVLGYINMHGACEQIKQVFRPQQVQLSPQQIAELQRNARLGGMA